MERDEQLHAWLEAYRVNGHLIVAVRTRFGREVRTFLFDAKRFPVEEAIEMATEDFTNQLREFLAKTLHFAEGVEPDPAAPIATIVASLEGPAMASGSVKVEIHRTYAERFAQNFQANVTPWTKTLRVTFPPTESALEALLLGINESDALAIKTAIEATREQ